jgi:hypothetical protein
MAPVVDYVHSITWQGICVNQRRGIGTGPLYCMVQGVGKVQACDTYRAMLLNIITRLMNNVNRPLFNVAKLWANIAIAQGVVWAP